MIISLVIRSFSLALVSFLLCLPGATCIGYAVFAPPPETEDPDAIHWNEVNRALGVGALGLVIFATGNLGFVGLSVVRAAQMAALTQERTADKNLPFSCRFVRRAVLILSVFLMLLGSVMMFVAGPCCFLFVLNLGFALVGFWVTENLAINAPVDRPR